ncbi:MAG: cysteine hydrolase [Nanoarchaeota archaeon]|nr:cysteine hydrolase [Nanoarchaeota archaeon]MBU4241699.1 cysteine hydrolase [Nanoarchaeota archaeon]MBU4352799.1 cysteine hydrolase [Nanoarchaeota archaeon]MCG2719145.1 cysteine hydrolase [Nanoarchaeota archaeon]
MKITFYDVDTQNDFMVDPDIHQKPTALYIPGAEHIRKNLEKLTNFARDNNYLILGSVDAHSKEDKELKRNNGPFPDHCMKGTWGQEKISETKPLYPIYIENKTIDNLEKLIEDKNEIFFEKQDVDVFTNLNAKNFLKTLNYVVVYGVATDYCVKAAVLGMLKLDLEVFVVEDAIAGITIEESDRAIEEIKDAGAYFFTTEEVLKGKVLKHIRAFEGIIQ